MLMQAEPKMAVKLMQCKSRKARAVGRDASSPAQKMGPYLQIDEGKMEDGGVIEST
jgi:hypothetical protein